MKILHDLCAVPTAPFAEERVVHFVEQFVTTRKELTLARDRFGNLLIERRGSASTKPRLVFVAHMDHPGFVAKEMLDDTTLLAHFRGGVLSDYVKGAKAVFFDNDTEVRGVVLETTAESDRAPYPSAARLRVNKRVHAGAIGMFDQGVGRVRGGRFYARVCDDLAGAAAALSMLDALGKQSTKTTVALLLTRAEEQGFIGAIASTLKPSLLRRDDRIISIECSAEQPYAKQGAGVILRVGDRVSVFHSGLTYFLNQQAAKLAAEDSTFRYQRCLMPGGACEATAFDAFGYIAAAICVPLGNYHNMDRKRRCIGAEYVNVQDWENMVKLFVQAAQHAHLFKEGHAELRRNLRKRFAANQALLRPLRQTTMKRTVKRR